MLEALASVQQQTGVSQHHHPDWKDLFKSIYIGCVAECPMLTRLLPTVLGSA
jgi:hypothetical protein